MSLTEDLVWAAAQALHADDACCGDPTPEDTDCYSQAARGAVVATLRTLADYESGSEDFDPPTRLLLTGALRSLANSVEGLF